MYTFSLFIITRDRLNSFKLTLESILQQHYHNFRIIISDNSTNCETKLFIEKEYYNHPKITYIKREKEYDLIEHWNKILSEVDSDYFMIFHDDDIMHPNMIKSMLDIITKDKSIAFIASNARIIKNNKIQHLHNLPKENTIRLHKGIDLFKAYSQGKWIPPFPSYIYSKSIAKKMTFSENKGGKYCDVAFLIDAFDIGDLIIMTKPHMDYYYHNGQISQYNDYHQRSKLINYIQKKLNINHKDDILTNFRLMNLYCWINTLLRNPNGYISWKRFITCLKIFLNHQKYIYTFKLITIAAFIKKNKQ